MSKIIIESTLVNKELNKAFCKTKGIKKGNVIKFKENDIFVTIFILNNKIMVNRNCKDYNLNLEFCNHKITLNDYNINGLGYLKVKLKTLNLDISDNLINVKYCLYLNEDEEIFDYKLKYKLI